MTSELDILASKQAITEVLYRYCRALDRMDADLARSVWHPGGTADYGAMFQGSGDGFMEWVWEAHGSMQAHSHQITNVLIEVDGDEARSEAYVTVALRTLPNDGVVTDIVSRGRYLDRFSRRAGRWAIDHRRFVEDLQHLQSGGGDAAVKVDGRRDREDPSYDILGW